MKNNTKDNHLIQHFHNAMEQFFQALETEQNENEHTFLCTSCKKVHGIDKEVYLIAREKHKLVFTCKCGTPNTLNPV